MRVPTAVARSIAWLTKQYVVRFPIARGKGVVLRTLVRRLPVEVREFVASLPGGGEIVLRFDEVIGRHFLRRRGFQWVELELARAAVGPESVAFDVGANVGVFTIPLALRAERVIAVEPLPENVARLRMNLARNGFANVDVVEAAAGAADGTIELQVAVDPGFASTRPLVKMRRASKPLEVRQRRLDSIWSDAGEPEVALVKADVEGAELDVLRGAQRLLTARHPLLLVEADPGPDTDVLRSWLGERGYREDTPEGFSPVNHLFRPTEARTIRP